MRRQPHRSGLRWLHQARPVVCLGFAGLWLWSAGPLTAHASLEPEVREAFKTVFVHFSQGQDGVRILQSECVIPRPASGIWAVLTDYDNLDEFIPILRESRVKAAAGQTLLLYQRGEFNVLFFRRGFRITAQVTETPPRVIAFDSVEGDFEVYRGWWRVLDQEDGTMLRHYLEIKPNFSMPKLIMKMVERGIVKSIIRRAMETVES